MGKTECSAENQNFVFLMAYCPATGEGTLRLLFAICQTTGPILDPKSAFDCHGLELSGHVAKVYLKVTNQ